MLKWLATLFASLVAIVAITAPANAFGIQESKQRHADQARLEAGLGDEAYGQKKWDEAIEHYTKAIDSNSCPGGCGKYLFRRGVAWQQKEDCVHALADYKKAEETLTDNGELFYNEFVCLSKANQNDEALAALDKAIKVNPDSTNYHYGRCIILFNKHDYAGALPDCEQTLGPAPDDQVMLVATATSAEQTGDKAKAAKYWRHLLELDKNNQQAKDGLARTGG